MIGETTRLRLDDLRSAVSAAARNRRARAAADSRGPTSTSGSPSSIPPARPPDRHGSALKMTMNDYRHVNLADRRSALDHLNNELS